MISRRLMAAAVTAALALGLGEAGVEGGGVGDSDTIAEGAVGGDAAGTSSFAAG